MNVASLEISKELYEVSGWDSDLKRLTYNEGMDSQYETLINIDDDEWDYYEDLPYTYDLGFLLRKLPPMRLQHWASGYWAAEWWSENLLMARGEDDIPEDAAAKLAIELFKQGILEKQ